MLQITESSLRDLETKTSKILVGECMRVIEEIAKQNLTKEESLSILKPLIKNKVYETFRQYSALIAQFSNGISFSIDFIRKQPDLN